MKRAHHEVASPSMPEFAEALFLAYFAATILHKTATVRIDPIADFICSQLDGWNRARFEKALEQVVPLMLKNVLPYFIMLEVDQTWSESASFARRKRENQIWWNNRPIAIIEMKRRREK